MQNCLRADRNKLSSLQRSSQSDKAKYCFCPSMTPSPIHDVQPHTSEFISEQMLGQDKRVSVASYRTVSARAALDTPCDGELLELLVKSSIDLSADFPLSARLPPFSKLSTSNLIKSSYIQLHTQGNEYFHNKSVIIHSAGTHGASLCA